MDNRKAKRTQLGFSQGEAARLAGVSLATWRRWENDESSVSARTQKLCEQVLRTTLQNEELDHDSQLEEVWEHFTQAWQDNPSISPRQAFAISCILNEWADAEIYTWLLKPENQPLDEIPPFHLFDLRVLFYINNNHAWAEKTRERCHIISEELEKGILPFDRVNCFMDEVLMAATLQIAPTCINDDPSLFSGIPSRQGTCDPDNDYRPDNDWDGLADYFDDCCRWDDWETPLMNDSELLSDLLALRHPFTWFNIEEKGSVFSTLTLNDMDTTFTPAPSLEEETVFPKTPQMKKLEKAFRSLAEIIDINNIK